MTPPRPEGECVPSETEAAHIGELLAIVGKPPDLSPTCYGALIGTALHYYHAALKRESTARADALREAAEAARSATKPHTYASENAEHYMAVAHGGELAALAIDALARKEPVARAASGEGAR